MPPAGRGTASLFTRDLLEKPSRLLFITSLYIYPRRVNRPHLAPPRFVLAALSPVVMNKTRPDGPRPGLFILFPWGGKLSPGASVASPTGPQPPPHPQHGCHRLRSSLLFLPSHLLPAGAGSTSSIPNTEGATAGAGLGAACRASGKRPSVQARRSCLFSRSE